MQQCDIYDGSVDMKEKEKQINQAKIIFYAMNGKSRNIVDMIKLSELSAKPSYYSIYVVMPSYEKNQKISKEIIPET